MTILIVEDIATNRKLLRAVLEGEDLTVLEANDGVAALAVLAREKVDAIISDILMPNMDGYRLCYEVRASPRFCHLPFIIYTATYTAGSDEKLSLQLGADKFLIKPSPPKTILAALHAVMSSPQRRRFKPIEPPRQLNLMKEYNERLVAKLEEKNLELGEKVETLLQADKRLRLSEMCYRRLFESAKDGILILDPTTRKIVDANPFMTELLGYAHEELLGKELWEIGLLQDEEASRAAFRELQEKHYIRYQDLPLKTKAGKCTEVEFVSNLYKEDGRDVIQCNIRDITERKRSEEAVRFSELRYRRLFESAKDGILILHASTGQIVDANPFMMDLLSCSLADLLEKNLCDIGLFKDIAACDAHLCELQTKDYIHYEDLRLENREGQRRDVEFVSNAYVVDHERVILCNIRDITERKRAEEEMRDMQNRLERTNRDLVKKSEEVQYFYHTLSHELKTPLTSAREFVSIVMDGLAGDLNPTQSEYLRIAKDSCTQLALYINDLLDATRLETGKLHIELKPVSLAAIIQRAMAIIRPVAAEKKISLTDEIDAQLVDAVMVDESRILQILTNLLNNAIKFTPKGGSIAVKLGPDSKCSENVQISVTDTGCGIAPDQLDRVFDRLYQVKAGDASTEGGVGLGLYLCHELVALHGGNIWVESEMGKGSTFSLVIPKQAAPKCSRVLIVDDDSGIRETLRLILEEKNFEVTTAEGGSEALQLISQKIPHVVVLDLRMTGLDGPSTLAEIRKNWELIPVIVHTGYPDSELLEEALKSSPFTLLAKPCPAERFVATVERVCRDHNTQFLKRNGAAALVSSGPTLVAN